MLQKLEQLKMDMTVGKANGSYLNSWYPEANGSLDQIIAFKLFLVRKFRTATGPYTNPHSLQSFSEKVLMISAFSTSTGSLQKRSLIIPPHGISFSLSMLLNLSIVSKSGDIPPLTQKNSPLITQANGSLSKTSIMAS